MTAPYRTGLGGRDGTPAAQAPRRSAWGLCAAERHTLESIRSWVALLHADRRSDRAQAAMARWVHLFGDAGGRQASHALDQFLAALACGTERAITTGCACCGRPSADELRLLAYLGAVWHRIEPTAEELAGHWLSSERQEMLEIYGRLYGYAMAQDGYAPPPPTSGRLRHIRIETVIQTSEIRLRQAETSNAAAAAVSRRRH